jgi:hypothetical protein
VAQIWAGTDIGKTHHHCVVLDTEGGRLLSRRVLNDEPELLTLLADVLALSQDVVWAVDVADGMAWRSSPQSWPRAEAGFPGTD